MDQPLQKAGDKQMKLICELTETVDYELIEEGDKPKQYFIEGIFMQSELSLIHI